MRIGVISDTHIPGAGDALPLRVRETFRDVDLILHAGDIYGVSVLDDLELLAPVLAAKGDDDHFAVQDRRVQEQHVLTVEGLHLWLVHQMPLPIFRAWMRGKSETDELEGAPDILVFGHTHCALVCNFEGILLVNPGSPTFATPACELGTVGLLTVVSGKAEARIVHL